MQIVTVFFLTLLAFAANAGFDINACRDPLVFRDTLETVTCPAASEPLGVFTQMITQGSVCLPGGTFNAGFDVDYCQADTCDGQVGACELQFTATDFALNVSDDLLCATYSVSVPSLTISSAIGGCTATVTGSFDLEAGWIGTYTDTRTWAFGDPASMVSNTENTVTNCDNLSAFIAIIEATLAGELETNMEAIIDDVLTGLSTTAYCPVESLHPAFVD